MEITETTAGQNLSQDLNDLMGGLNLEKILPELGGLVGNLETWVRLSLFVVPLVLSVLGIWYFFFPPREANRHIGFRSMFSMGSTKAWGFAQKLAGALWGGLGFVLLVVMLVITAATKTAPIQKLLPTVITWLIIQLVLVLVGHIAIQVILARQFDYQGIKRKNKK